MADLVYQVDPARHFLADELGLEGAGLPHQTAACLATPLARSCAAREWPDNWFTGARWNTLVHFEKEAS
jgi:hypothetical protein